MFWTSVNQVHSILSILWVVYDFVFDAGFKYLFTCDTVGCDYVLVKIFATNGNNRFEGLCMRSVHSFALDFLVRLHVHVHVHVHVKLTNVVYFQADCSSFKLYMDFSHVDFASILI